MMPADPHTAQCGKRISDPRIAEFSANRSLDLARESGIIPSRDNAP
jgi:hypothetical protein